MHHRQLHVSVSISSLPSVNLMIKKNTMITLEGQRIVPRVIVTNNNNDRTNRQLKESKQRPTNWSATPCMTAKERQRRTQAWASHSAMRAWIRYRRQMRSRSSWAAGPKSQKHRNRRAQSRRGDYHTSGCVCPASPARQWPKEKQHPASLRGPRRPQQDLHNSGDHLANQSHIKLVFVCSRYTIQRDLHHTLCRFVKQLVKKL